MTAIMWSSRPSAMADRADESLPLEFCLRDWADEERSLHGDLWGGVEKHLGYKAAAEIEALRTNATRYNWLREQMALSGAAMVYVAPPGGDWGNCACPRAPEELDAAIDAYQAERDEP